MLSGKCKYDGGFTLQKEGYYKTGRRHIFCRDSDDDVEETLFTRKWIPDYVCTEILKKIRNPIPMYARRSKLKVPMLDTPIGFDLQEADWIKPYGTGKTLDMTITLHSTEIVISPTNKWLAVGAITLAFPNPMDGIQICKTDEWSDFISSYAADLTIPFDENCLLSSFPFQRDIFLASSSYLIFRTRSKLSPTGELLSCHYGKIYPTILAHVDKIEFAPIYFNPTPNDTNLEFAPGQSLSSKETLEDERRSNVQRP